MLTFIATDNCTRYSRLRESHFFGTQCTFMKTSIHNFKTSTYHQSNSVGDNDYGDDRWRR